MPGGRPSSYTDDMPERVLNVLSNGGIRAHVCAELRITFETLHDWTNPESPRFKPELREALDIGIQLSEAHWTSRMADNLVIEKGSFQQSAWALLMKNSFGWREKTEVSGNAAEPLVVIGTQSSTHAPIAALPDSEEDEDK